MQTKLIAGDSLSWYDEPAAYPSTDGWTHKYRIVPRIAGTAITLVAVAEGTGYRTTATSATTAVWDVGTYDWSRWVEKVGERATLESGVIQVLLDPAAYASGTETRSHVERALANIEAMIEGRATKDVQEYTIGDRALKHIPLNELLVWRDKYRAQLASERTGSGLGMGRKILVRM